MAKECVKGLAEELKSNARRVITRRLHMSLPCIGMGIPVVLAHECDSGQVEECRFAGSDRIIRVYKPSEYGSIDRDPDIELLKETAIQLAMQKIEEAKNYWGGLAWRLL